MEVTKIKISKNYSSTPGPRSENEGDYSGARFRKEILVPALKEAIQNDQKLIIDLDGTAGFGTSFLEESFGGLIREDGFSYKIILNHIEFISEEEPYLIDDIYGYMDDAEKALEK